MGSYPDVSGGDKRGQNGDNPPNSCSNKFGKSSVIFSRVSALLLTAACAVVLGASYAQAQWWSRAPVDFEECADKAEKAATKEERRSQLTNCNAKFAGRRKPGGGYTYFDFMQNRSFDIAGPNPSPEEQKKIDQHYTAYLDRERQSRNAAAVAVEQQLFQQASLRSESIKVQPSVPARAQPRNKPHAATSDAKPRSKVADCPQYTFSCDWPRLSAGIKDLKKLFDPAPAKAGAADKRG
jgi:hypothetical protein